MSAARPPRSIRVGTIRPCLRERSPAVLLRVSALRVTIACAGAGFPTVSGFEQVEETDVLHLQLVHPSPENEVRADVQRLEARRHAHLAPVLPLL
jgi:hypothetical protein